MAPESGNVFHHSTNLFLSLFGSFPFMMMASNTARLPDPTVRFTMVLILATTQLLPVGNSPVKIWAALFGC